MMQNIIAYSVILFLGGLSLYYLYKDDHKKSLIILIVCYWVTNIGVAYHVRSFNEAKQEAEGRVCQILNY